jgi:endonuclease V-like protein UPF0215 family
MKAIAKIGILLMALVITVAGFNWITCCSGCADIAKITNKTNLPMIADSTLHYEIVVKPQ